MFTIEKKRGMVFEIFLETRQYQKKKQIIAPQKKAKTKLSNFIGTIKPKLSGH